MKKLFISQPMNGKSNSEIQAERKKAIEVVKDYLHEDVQVINSYFQNYDPETCTPLKYLAYAIEKLADADIAYFVKGWEMARGCNVEYLCAYSYDIPIITPKYYDKPYLVNRKLSKPLKISNNKISTIVRQSEPLLDLEDSNTKKIKIKYFYDDIEKIKKIEQGDWIDLRVAEDTELKAGEFKLIPLGVGMILPDGYEAHIVPRSSTFSKFGVIQTNHHGIIDQSYCGEEDMWRFPAYALRDTVLHKNDRICQFRIVKKQEEIEFEEVEKLNDASRGGFGSTGVQ